MIFDHKELLKQRIEHLTKWLEFLNTRAPRKQANRFEQLNKASLISIEIAELNNQVEKIETSERNQSEVEALCRDHLPGLIETVKGYRHRMTKEEIHAVNGFNESMNLKSKWDYYQLATKLIHKYQMVKKLELIK